MEDFEAKKRQAAEHYSTLGDEELGQLADEAWSLTDAGKEALRAELARRGLTFGLATTPAPKAAELNLVTLRRFTDMPDALLAKGVLESAGIESFLIDETTIRMDWLWSNALGGIKLCVAPEAADAATQLLGLEIPEKFIVEGVGNFDQPQCPQCQSLDVSYEDLNKRVAYAGMLFLGFPIPLKRHRWRCETCGHEWQSTGELKQES